MSLNTKKQRAHLYGLSFLKWTPEQRLSTLEKTSIECSLAVHKFGNDANEAHFNKFAESLSDFETMLEVAEETFPSLRFKMDEIKKQKLTVLKKQTLLKNEAKKHEEKAEQFKEKASNISTVIEKQQEATIKSKGLLRLLGK